MEPRDEFSPSVERRFRRLEEDSALSRDSREHYIPIIERTASKVEAIEDEMSRLVHTATHIADRLDLLADRIGPLLTVHEMAVKAMKFVVGIILGIVVALAEEYLRHHLFSGG